MWRRRRSPTASSPPASAPTKSRPIVFCRRLSERRQPDRNPDANVHHAARDGDSNRDPDPNANWHTHAHADDIADRHSDGHAYYHANEDSYRNSQPSVTSTPTATETSTQTPTFTSPRAVDNNRDRYADIDNSECHADQHTYLYKWVDRNGDTESVDQRQGMVALRGRQRHHRRRRQPGTAISARWKTASPGGRGKSAPPASSTACSISCAWLTAPASTSPAPG